MRTKNNNSPGIKPAFLEAAHEATAFELGQGDKVCLFLAHNSSLLFVVRFHEKDSSISVEPAGGKIDPKAKGGCETIAEALIREGHEEYGVIVRPRAMLGIEPHPFTQKPVGYFACDVIDGIPYNAADKEHLGIIQIPISKVECFKTLSDEALRSAREIVSSAIPHTPPSRPIEFRVPEKLVMNFIQQIQDEPGAAFLTRAPN